MRRSARPAARRTALAALLATGLAVPAAQAATPADRTQPATYRNPVSQGFADTFADPSLLRGKDGWWYAVGTSDPLREGEGTPHQIPIARSRDLVSLDARRRRLHRGHPSGLGHRGRRPLGARPALRRRRVPHVLRGHRHHRHPRVG
ncbi:hypothetical protein GCM10025868_11690 [Angustibacter aerolatus]|uniref:Glycosyl hydrolase family 32 N-terminal domain-containing protein n=1 Tax=Angustibacter aerolatus TaxID=1162965 RepID=A0ABQ6JDN9_9ACTN|nr:hypothetical protein [Angustibacter aerolatus]GMA85919.1 hypothetical protein GCM10025868_11690 [Angustibacter aerolatus]